MCGICGIISERQTEPPDRKLLAAMTKALTHRGPDAEGVHVDGCVALGHRRLSIIDLAGGSQPMVNDDRSVGWHQCCS